MGIVAHRWLLKICEVADALNGVLTIFGHSQWVTMLVRFGAYATLSRLAGPAAGKNDCMRTVQVARPGRSWSRIDGVDCLRALAIFTVLINHVNMRLFFAHVPYLRGLPRQLGSSLVWQGQNGVQIFFAVSGFLITATSLRRWGALSLVSIKDFYLLRFARIAPLLLLLLLVLSMLHGLRLRDFTVSAERGGLPAALLAALTFRVNWFEATRGYLPGNWDILWSLSVEEMFYLFFPVVCRLARGRWIYAVLAIFIVLGPFGRTVLTHGNETWQEYSYLGGMDAIAMGCCTALLLHDRALRPAAVRTCAVCGLGLLLFCLGFSRTASRIGLDASGLGMTLVGLGACLLIAASAESGWRAPRRLGPLLAYGRRSYEVYLTHMFVVFGCFNFFFARGKPLGWVAALFLAVILLAGLLGEGVGRFCSEPANRWLRGWFGEGAGTMGAEVPAP